MKRVIRRNRNAVDTIAKLKYLLQLEYEEEKKIYSASITGKILKHQIDLGNAFSDISFGRIWYNSLNQRVLEILMSHEFEIKKEKNKDELKDHNFEYGKPITILETNLTGDDKIKIISTGTVNFNDSDRLIITVPDDFEIPVSTGKQYSIILSFDETSYRAMFESLERLLRADGRLGQLRDLIYSANEFKEKEIYPVTLSYLNEDQQKSVNKVLAAQDVAVVHGPPGTGKTTTLVEAIYETLRRESQVLVCAQSNSAVDLICERLIDRGINVLRIGNPSRVNDTVLSNTYERRFEAHPDYPILWKIRRTIRELRKTAKRSDNWYNKLCKLKKESVEIEMNINSQLFNEARVIASTLVGSDQRILDYSQISTLFIDEAAQALEAATWIPIRRAKRVILAGDHCQLPPTVKSYEAMKQGMAVTLMEKIVEMHPESVSLLTQQYRMHQDIMKFSNDWFYGGNMTAASEVRFRSILDWENPIEWIDTSKIVIDETAENKGFTFKESLDYSGNGRMNIDEALLTLHTLQEYIRRIGENRIVDEKIDFAIISPYRSQVKYLRKLISSSPFLKKFRKNITINTIDGFQGRERDVVLISLVRSNDENNIGFLNDLRRMNVAITRARMKVIIIGDFNTLSKHPFYNKLHSYIVNLKK